MNILTRIVNRLRFRKTIKNDESINVVDGMVKAKSLYKKLSVMIHPDRNPERREQAEELMAKIVENRHNYSNLQELEKEVITFLNNK